MSGGTKRNSDKLNTIGIVVVGICGAALVHVSITLLMAFYMSDTSDVQTMADYGGQDTAFQRTRADELANITQCSNVMGTAGGGNSTHKILIEDAMRLVVEDARRDPAMLVPQLGRADKATIKAKFDRPEPLTAPAAPAALAPDPDDAGAPAASAIPAPAVAPVPAGGTVPGAVTPAPAAPATPPPPPAR